MPTPEVPTPAKPEVLSDEELYRRIDETYGLPIGSLQSKAVVAEFRAQGFNGSEPEIHPGGLPDFPEAKRLQTWYLDKKLPTVTISLDIVGDYRGALRNVEIMIVTKDGLPIVGKAPELIPPIMQALKLPRATKWFVEHSGKKRVEGLEGIMLESVGNSSLSWMYIVKGSNPRSAGTTTDVPAQPPVKDYHTIRQWSDSTGSFKVMASFVSLANGKVKLKKEDGKAIDVAVENLSTTDQTFLEDLKARGQ